MSERRNFLEKADGAFEVFAGAAVFWLGAFVVFLGYDTLPGEDAFEKVGDFISNVSTPSTTGYFETNSDGSETIVTVSNLAAREDRENAIAGVSTMFAGVALSSVGFATGRHGFKRLFR